MTSELLMTVVIPTYRRPAQLRACLAGLEAQTRSPDEVVVVVRESDGASLSEVEGSSLPLRVVHPRESGLVHAIRTGLETVAEGVVVVADDDTVAAPDWLERYASAFAPGVVAVGGMNQVYVGGEAHHHRSRRVGRLSYAGAMVGMHYAESGLRGVEVEHLQGCNMAFLAPAPLPDTALVGDGAYYELDMCLRAGRRGRIVYDERIHVDHHLGGRADRDGESMTDALAARRETDLRQVATSCWNYGYVMSKNTPGRLQRSVRLLHGLLVGQRRTWGVARVVVEACRHPSASWGPVLRVALANRLGGWAEGRAARATDIDAP